MASRRIDRRGFHKLTSAALGGLAAGAVLGCSGNANKPGGAAPGAGGGAGVAAAAELHLCRGLNECKSQGKGGQNDCRGQGACATAKAHTCHAQNDCKGQGGCGENPGANDCKGKGACNVPLEEEAWDKLRKKKEAEWAEKKTEFGAAPAKAG